MNSYFRDTWSDLRSMPRALWVITGGQFINRFGCFVYPFLTLFLIERGYAPAQVALILGAMAAGNLAAPVLSGYLTDGIGRRNTIVLSLVSGAVTVVLLFYCRTGWQLAAMAALHGTAANLFGPAAHALLADVVPDERRVTAYAVFRLALNAGYAAGPATGGLLYAISPALIFWGDAATTLVFAGLSLWLLPHGLRTIKGRMSSLAVAANSWRDAIVDLGRNRPAVQLVAAKILMSLSFVQVFHVLSIHAVGRGLTTVQYGVIMGLNGAIIMVAELPLVQWLKRFSPRSVLIVGFVLVGVGCAGFSLTETMTGFLVAMAVFTLGEMISLPISAALGARLAPEEFRGRYFGFYGMAWGLAGVMGSVGVWLYSEMGAWWWLVSGAVGATAGLVMALQVKPRSEPEPVDPVVEPAA